MRFKRGPYSHAVLTGVRVRVRQRRPVATQSVLKRVPDSVYTRNKPGPVCKHLSLEEICSGCPNLRCPACHDTMTAEKGEKKSDFVNRVNQLDAVELDGEVSLVLKQQIAAVFKSLEPSLLSRFEPEIDAALSFIIWRISVRANGSTFGHQMLGLRFSKQGRFDRNAAFWAYLLLPVLCRYFRERSRNVASYLRVSATERGEVPGSSSAILLSKTVSRVQLILAAAELINFLLFLRQGRYPNLITRLLDLKIIPQDGRSAHRPVGYSYVTRELLWHSFIELLMFTLPLVNYHYLRRVVLNVLTWGAKASSVVSVPEPNPLTLSTRCAVCALRPILPHRMGCQHVFCYYCLKARVTADPKVNCPSCGHRMDDPSAVTAA